MIERDLLESEAGRRNGRAVEEALPGYGLRRQAEFALRAPVGHVDHELEPAQARDDAPQLLAAVEHLAP